jgi:5-methylcytosine-specific restriction enzyme subunit McrC
MTSTTDAGDDGVLRLREYTTTKGIPLSVDERDALKALPVDLRIAPTPGTDDRYDLTPDCKVGVARFGTRTLEIRPRLPLDRVLFLASYALEAVKWPTGDVSITTAPDLVEAVARLFAKVTEPAMARGLLQGYVQLEDRLTTIRGRIRFAEQISRWNGQIPPVEVTYDDYTIDIVENQLLKAAALRLATLGGRTPETSSDLRRISFRLADVATIPYGGPSVPEVTWNRLNEHYRPAVELARLILQSTGLESASGSVTAPSFMLNMAMIFERFVQRALRDRLGLNDRTFPENSRSHPLRLDTGGLVALKPDLSWWEGPQCLFVGDCKYKRTDSAIEHADLYQLLAYSVATDLPGGLLVYAAGEAEPTDHVVRHAGKVLTVRTLDLAGSPTAILQQIDDLAVIVRRLAITGKAHHDQRLRHSAGATT